MNESRIDQSPSQDDNDNDSEQMFIAKLNKADLEEKHVDVQSDIKSKRSNSKYSGKHQKPSRRRKKKTSMSLLVFQKLTNASYEMH